MKTGLQKARSFPSLAQMGCICRFVTAALLSVNIECLCAVTFNKSIVVKGIPVLFY